MDFLKDPEAAKAFFTVVGGIIGGIVTTIGVVLTVRQARSANQKSNAIAAATAAASAAQVKVNDNTQQQTAWSQLSAALQKQLTDQDLRMTKQEDKQKVADEKIAAMETTLHERDAELVTTQRKLTIALDYVRTLLQFLARQETPHAPMVPQELIDEL